MKVNFYFFHELYRSHQKEYKPWSTYKRTGNHQTRIGEMPDITIEEINRALTKMKHNKPLEEDEVVEAIESGAIFSIKTICNALQSMFTGMQYPKQVSGGNHLYKLFSCITSCLEKMISH